jgi:hypothetical protein
MPIPLDEATLEKVRGLGDPTSMLDVARCICRSLGC